MTLKMERHFDGTSTTIRLIGRMRREYLEVLKAQMEESGTKVTLDLREVTLVDVDVVVFLGSYEAQGVELAHCSPYISHWISRERDRQNKRL